MRTILHDWSDSSSITILRNLRTAFGTASATLAIVEVGFVRRLIQDGGRIAELCRNNPMEWLNQDKHCALQIDMMEHINFDGSVTLVFIVFQATT